MLTVKYSLRAVLALMFLMILGLANSQAEPPEPRELPALQEAPTIPVRSIPLRRDFPDHPFGAPPGQAGPAGAGCDKGIDLTSTISGVEAIAAQDNGICTNADIDTYVNVIDGETYVVQAGGEQAAFTITHIDANGTPTLIDQVAWRQKNTYTPDVKAFVQSDDEGNSRNYIVLSLERLAIGNAACGVVFIDVTDSRGTDPPLPPIVHQEIGSDPATGGGSWCDVHNTFVENIDGEGRYVYLTADGPNDMRVLDIANIADTDPIEKGRYTALIANNSNYVHDITVIDHNGSTGRRVYLSYWNSGLVVLDAADVTPGINPTPIIGPNVIDPSGFSTHHAWADLSGNLVFIQDEFLNTAGDEPVQMWDVSNPASPIYIDGLVLGTDVPVNPAHNLEINFGIDPDRLYVGWYKLGLQAWDFDPFHPVAPSDPLIGSLGFIRYTPSPPSSVLYHQAQTETSDDDYSGAWGVRLAVISPALFIFQSDRGYGLIVNCVSCPTLAIGSISGLVSESGTGNPIAGATVSVDTGQSTTSGDDGSYTLDNVPTGDHTVTATASGYVSQQQPTTVTDGGTSFVDFVLEPELINGSGGLNGKVTNASTGRNLSGVLVEIVESSQSDTTNNGGRYKINDVSVGQVTVRASKTGFVTQERTDTVIAGQTTTVNFAL